MVVRFISYLVDAALVPHHRLQARYRRQLRRGLGDQVARLRGRGAGFGLAALGTGAWKGAAVGAGMGAAALPVTAFCAICWPTR